MLISKDPDPQEDYKAGIPLPACRFLQLRGPVRDAGGREAKNESSLYIAGSRWFFSGAAGNHVLFYR
jgi:hypothetical protein